MKTIGILTKDFSLYHDLIKVLRKRKIGYVSLTSINNIPKKIGVIITSHSELHDFKIDKIIAADIYDTVDHAIDLALQLLIGKNLYSSIYIGIDPGEKPGVAVVGDGIILQKTDVESPENVLAIVKRFIKEYPSNECIIRIGHGSPISRNRIINSLIPLDLPIEIVDETKTTSIHHKNRSKKDSEAAASIALLPGGLVQNKLPLSPKKGDIKNIQEKSRKLTNGKYSISKQTAIKVLKGEISLSKAVEKENKDKKP